MRLSIVLPTFNEAEVIDEAIRSVRSLKGEIELLVVDGQSTDHTVKRAQAAGVTPLSAPRGRASQLNRGAGVATGDVLLFLHADVSLPHNAHALISECLSKPDVKAGAFKTWAVTDRPSRLGPLLHVVDLRSRFTRYPYGDQAFFIQRSLFIALGGFRDLALMEDLDLSHRAAAIAPIALINARVLVSGRRFITRPIYYTAVMTLFPALFRLGVPTQHLARIYEAIR